MIPFDLPPKPAIWTPPKPAIIRAASMRDLAPNLAMPMLGTFAAASKRGVSAKAGGIQQIIAFSGGTNFGNGTIGGGIAAQIDGNTNQAIGASARTSVSNTRYYGGYTFPAGHPWTGAKVYATNNGGFHEAGNNGLSLSIDIRASNGAAPTNTTEATSNGTLLKTITATEANSAIFQDLAISNSTAYTSIWATFPGISGETSEVAELVFYATE